MTSTINLLEDKELEKISAEEQCNKFNHCMVNIFEFAKYAKVRDETTNTIVPFQMWPHIKLL